MFCRSKALLVGLCWLSLSVALLPTQAHAGLLYSNGGLNPQPLTKSGVAPPQSGMWSELQNNAGDTTSSNTILGVTAEQGRNHLADDFTIPAGETWTIGYIDFYGFLQNSAATPSPFTAMNVQIWNGRPGDPGTAVIAGDLTTNVLTSSTDTMIFRQANTVAPPPGLAVNTNRRIWRNRVTFSPGIKLSAGTYWIEWQSKVSTLGQGAYVQNTVEGMRALDGWNARQYVASTMIWQNVIDAGSPSTAPDVVMDFPFEIYAAPLCGDSIIEGAEQCDDGNTVSGDGCDSNCTRTACGNRVKAGNEQCDDGNTVDGDGCDSNCTTTACGNGIVTTDEVCDDGNTVNGDSCDNNCTVPACGNGAKVDTEQCDDGNTIDGDGCDSDCTSTVCGNGIVTAGEACDDGNTVNGDSCDNNCTVPACGNGAKADTEQCDDGNTIDGDGCSASCTVEVPEGGGGCASSCKVSGRRTDWSPLFFWIALAAMAPFSWRRRRQTL